MSWEQAGRLERAGSELEQAGRLESARSKLGASWSKGRKLGGWRELGASWERAGARGVSWSKLGGWRELGASWSKGSELEQAGRLERAGSKLEQGE